ncbi:MAG: phosphoethanolamine transferase [Thermomonas sp.]
MAKRIWWRPCLSTEALIALVCAYFVFVCNGPFWEAVRTATSSLRVLLSLGVAVFALHAVVFGLFAFGRFARPLLAVLLVTTSLVHWYMTRYAVVIDAEMIRNVLHTDMAESRELVSIRMLLHVFLLGVLPAVLVLLTRPRQRPRGRSVLLRVGFLLAMVLLTGAALGASSQGVFSLMRSDPALRYKITPGNFIVSLVNVLKQNSKAAKGPRQVVAADAHRPAEALVRRPRVLLLVVGETVRGDHWGLNGYARQTTPNLAARNIVNFPDVSACGTSTEVSLPCMFSEVGRENYDRHAIRSHESVLDAVQRAGVRVHWRDNQSGCKDTCTGVPFETMSSADAPGLCAGGRCFDEILLSGLAAKINAGKGDVLIVLHQLGNHGPNYFERYPPHYERWKPVCKTAELSLCTKQEIVNAYDNAILYTDAVLDQLIDLLESQTERDAAMLYVSDHGESLGEYGLFLHGAPQAIAPKQQLHVPMALWMSPGFINDDRVDLACLQAAAKQPASHDDLFSTVLGVFDVETKSYRKERDLLESCRTR